MSETKTKSIIQYIRKKNGRPIGCVVILDSQHIGFCLLHKKDQEDVNQKISLRSFATIRATNRQVEIGKIPNDKNKRIWFYDHRNEFRLVPHAVKKILDARYTEVIDGDSTSCSKS